MPGRIIGCHARGKIGNHGMFSLIRPTKVEGHGGRAGHIHHSQGGKLLQLLRKGRVNSITGVRGAEERRSGRGSPSDTERGEVGDDDDGGVHTNFHQSEGFHIHHKLFVSTQTNKVYLWSFNILIQRNQEVVT